MKPARSLALISVLAGASAAQAPAPLHTYDLPLRVKGRAVDVGHQPLAGVALALSTNGEADTQQALEAPLIKTGADGGFALELPGAKGRKPRGPWWLMLAAPGRAAMLRALDLDDYPDAARSQPL